MKFAFAIVLICLLAANSLALHTDKPPNAACIDATHSIGWETNMIFCLGLPLDLDGLFSNEKHKHWVGRVTKNVPKPYSICCDSVQPKAWL